MVELIAGSLITIGCLWLAFGIGKREADFQLKKDNETLKRVQKNLNAVILDQRHEIASVVGLWATDNVKLIQHHANRERFFRIGYPEHKL